MGHFSFRTKSLSLSVAQTNYFPFENLFLTFHDRMPYMGQFGFGMKFCRVQISHQWSPSTNNANLIDGDNQTTKKKLLARPLINPNCEKQNQHCGHEAVSTNRNVLYR